MPAIDNPVDDKVRSARKRHGSRAALWALLTSLYASGRDAEAEELRDGMLLHQQDAEEILRQALALPDIAGGLGEGLVGWVALRYQEAERSGDPGKVRHIESVLPRAAYPVTEWTQRSRPRPNLFDMSVDEAYEAAKEFLGNKATRPVKQGPVVFQFNDGWTVQDLNTKALLVDEGNHQHICVGQDKQGYPRRVMNGQIKVYSLRDAEGRPHLTMTWSGYNKIYEASMAYNDTVESEGIRSRLVAFAESLGMEFLDLLVSGAVSGVKIDLRGKDMSNRDLNGVSLRQANMSEANLSGSVLSHADLSGANLKKADLRDAAMLRVSMISADLRGADIRNAFLEHADLSNAKLSRAKLDDARMSNADLFRANLSNASIVAVNLRRAHLDEANLSGADFREAKLDGAALTGAFYNSKTQWPNDFDPVEAGAILVKD